MGQPRMAPFVREVRAHLPRRRAEKVQSSRTAPVSDSPRSTAVSRVTASVRVDRRRLTCLVRRRVAERKVNDRVVEAQSSQRHLWFRVLRCLDRPKLKHSRNLRAFDLKVQKRSGVWLRDVPCAAAVRPLRCSLRPQVRASLSLACHSSSAALAIRALSPSIQYSDEHWASRGPVAAVSCRAIDDSWQRLYSQGPKRDLWSRV